MKIRIFVPNIDFVYLSLVDGHYHYLCNVLRVKKDDVVYIFNSKDGEWMCKIKEITKNEVILNPEQQLDVQDKCLNVTVCTPFMKPDTMSTIIRQSVEMGISRIDIFNADRSSIRNVNIGRSKVIAVEALEQCGGIFLPEINFFDSLQALIFARKNIVIPKNKDKDTNKILPGTFIVANVRTAGNGEDFVLSSAIKEKPVYIFVGPEGGFSNRELDFFTEIGAIFVSLGNRLLRTDTAMLSMITMAKINKLGN